MIKDFFVWLLSFLHYFIIRVLKTHEIPDHVAIIMDGNRRQAVYEGKKPNEGHIQGAEKLSNVLL